MRIRAIASAGLGLAVTVAIVAACLPEVQQAGAGQGRGHEGAASAVVPAPKEERASRVVVPPQVEPSSAASSLACRTILDRVQSIEKAAPDAAIYRHWAGAPAIEFLSQFNADHGTQIAADEVAIVVSAT
jgi:hypothetical protein